MEVDLLVMVFMASGFTIRFFGMWVVDNYGLGNGVHLSALLNCFGVVLRWLGAYLQSYPILLSGQIFCASGMAFLDIAGPKLSANWFPPKERTIATAVASGPVFLGLLFGYASAPLLVKTGSDLPAYMLYEAIYGVAAFALAFFFFVGNPPIPPSLSAASEKMKMGQAFLVLFR
jgi:FLVCR family feline leukemia virus subgroup C receptor-related protein